ncbi:Plectin 1 [Labilithrix luteola]|uniref:Plectin 1 n=2 Tax=Labilithrix luteola TaxID=1391654 RepID=A0A0K1QF91_9BACT|nr:Plectin 1 [Labilithrix luteola]
MTSAQAFRQVLTRRIFALLAVSLPLPVAACSLLESHSSTDGCQGGPREIEWCIAATPEGEGGVDAGDSSDPDSGLPPGTSCPSREDARSQISYVDDVKTEATVKDGGCCYTVVYTTICEGRPYIVDTFARTAVTARAVRGGAFTKSYRADGLSPCVDSLDPAARAALAAQWTRDALYEHASVASFARFAMELLAVGAPADLVEDAHRAGLDEMRHARLCFTLASAYAGEPVAPGRFPFDGNVEVSSDLASVAARAVTEGCIGETLAAAIAAEQLASAVDPAVRAALATIAEDEARHAELAWHFVAWAVRAGGHAVCEAVAEAFRASSPSAPPVIFAGDLTAHGRLDSAQLDAAAARALDEIVRPCARALLAPSAFERNAHGLELRAST